LFALGRFALASIFESFINWIVWFTL
jgi:hypothetical protein